MSLATQEPISIREAEQSAVEKLEHLLKRGIPSLVTTTGEKVKLPATMPKDGKFDAAVFRPSDTNWYILKSTGGVQIQQFGAANDIPLPGAFVP